MLGVGGFILVTLGCWFLCRYNYTKLRIPEELPEKELKIRFYRKVPTLILKENKARAAAEQGLKHQKPNGGCRGWCELHGGQPITLLCASPTRLSVIK